MLDIQPHTKSSRKRGRSVVDAVPALFDKTLLNDEVAVEAAIRAFERHLVDSATILEEVVVELESFPVVLEFVLSTVDEGTYRRLCTAILQHFPNTSREFLNSITSKLLSRFPLFLLFLPDIHSTSFPEADIRDCRRATEIAVGVLQALVTLRLEGTSEEVFDDEFLSEYTDVQFAVKRKGQNKRKQAKRRGRMPSTDAKPFANYGAEVPQTEEEARRLCAKILEEQMNILETYLELLRAPPLLPLIKNMYLPPPADIVDVSAERDVTSLNTSAFEEDNAEVPSAYPLVQPMKAALYFDSAEGFGQWRILISTRADRDLRQARRRDAKTFRIFVKKIKELSNGHFSDDNQKRLTGLDVEIPIYEAKMTGDTRLVYQIDCVPEFESDVERQVLKIYGIYTHAQLDRRFWDCMSRQLGRRGAEYKKRCTFRNGPINRGDNVIQPASWPPPAEPAVLEPMSVLDMRKEDLEEIHSLLVLEKFVTFSQALLNSIIADKDATHVFDVTPQEKKIIEHTSSCYVLGRSGTGKTTTMLFKMLGIERAWESRRDSMPKPRQLFVTQSRVLAEKVEEFFSKLLESLSSASQTPAELAKTAARKQQQQEQGLVDRDEEIYWRGDLPKRYGALQDEHFPMFLTYDHICRLLEGEFHYGNDGLQKKEAVSRAVQQALELQDPQTDDGNLSNDYMQQRRVAFVSFGTFLEEYWSHFPQSLTKGLDPTLVFGEFMGVIKGSELALEQPEGYLSKEAYCNLSHRTQGTFANQRDCIYKLFQAYLKRKKDRGDYDAADRTHALIKYLRLNRVPGQEIDFIYVDEAQDNLLIDALVLRTLCRNPNGMFWAGDTAQTISVGSAFRFNDLKSFLYRFEEASTALSVGKQTPPETFHLAVNYRSHAGIVNCAHSVIQLITEFWPHAIDALAEEKGMIDGLKPVFFSGWDQNTVRYEQFLFGESGNHIEFGAEQCILVRDDAARDKLRAQVGDIGLILTLYESKGLEFNDVLLYNFFEDSTVDLSHWRVVLNVLPQEKRANHPAPRFDDVRHSGVCRELKFLYVAITRARKNLWIADGSEKGEPMRIMWTHKNQIQNCTPGTDVPRLAISSTPEAWARTALSLFNNRRYMQAMHCYDRAGLFREKGVAHAYYLREVARSTPVTRGDTTAQALAFVAAAEAFLASALQAVKEKKVYYRIAAECYVHSGDIYKAAQAYSSATEYTLAAQHFRKAGKFEEAVDIIKSHKDKVAATVAESIIDVSRLYFLREKQIKKARELFDTDEEALEYMDDYGLDVARATLLEELGKYAGAADVHFAEGNTPEAIRLLLQDRDNQSLMQKAFQRLLDGLWSNLSCGVSINEELLKADGTVAKLLRFTTEVENVKVNEDLQDEVLMFRAIAERDLQSLHLLAERFLRRQNVPAAFLCLDRLFSVPLKLQVASLAEIVGKLGRFLVYARILRRLLSAKEPGVQSVIHKIFAIQTNTEDHFLLQKGSLLAIQCNNRLTPSARTNDQGILVPRWELERLIKHVLKERLLSRVNEENTICRDLRQLHPCLAFSVFRQCNRIADCRRNHVESELDDAAAYNSRVRIVILQILIYQTIYAVENLHELARQRRHWLRQLDEALFPPYYKLGSFHILSRAAIPELEQGLGIACNWAQELLYALDPYRSAAAFLTLFMRVSRLVLRFNSKAALDYLPRTPCVSKYRPPDLLRGNEKAYVVHDLLSFMQNDEITALNRGVLFLNRVLEKKVHVDIGILCDFIDHLCGCLIITVRSRANQVLHDVTLPKSWMLRLMPKVDQLRSMQTQLSRNYTKNMGELLEQIYSGYDATHLLYENRDLSVLPYQIRNIFFARVCRNLVLWGYNRHSFPVQNGIRAAIASVNKPGRAYSPIIIDYVRARHWDDLARTVRHSVKDSVLDEMIQLHHGSTPVPKTSLPNVRRIVYNREEDIPYLLMTDSSNTTNTGLRAEALPFVPTHVVSDVIETEGAEETPETTEDIGGDEEILEQDVDIDNITQAIDAGQANVAPTEISPEKLAAAAILAAILVAAHERRTAQVQVRRKSAEEMRRRVFTTFLKQAQEMEWPHRYYRMLFLGPIPHLYIVAESMKNHLREARNNARKRLNVAKHLELENVQSSLNEMRQSFKDALRLYETLAPTSDLHKERDLEALKACALEAETLMRGLPSSATLEWEKDMKIALKGIVEVKKVPVKQAKPELNVSEDLLDGETGDEYYEY